MLTLTCYNKVTTNAHTTQARSKEREVSTRGPLRGGSSPGLGGGQVIMYVWIQVVISSADNEHLHSDCYRNIQNLKFCVLPKSLKVLDRYLQFAHYGHSVHRHAAVWQC